MYLYRADRDKRFAGETEYHGLLFRVGSVTVFRSRFSRGVVRNLFFYGIFLSVGIALERVVGRELNRFLVHCGGSGGVVVAVHSLFYRVVFVLFGEIVEKLAVRARTVLSRIEKIVLAVVGVADNLGRPHVVVRPARGGGFKHGTYVFPRFHIFAAISRISVTAKVAVRRRVHEKPAVIGIRLVIDIDNGRIGARRFHFVFVVKIVVIYVVRRLVVVRQSVLTRRRPARGCRKHKAQRQRKRDCRFPEFSHTFPPKHFFVKSNSYAIISILSLFVAFINVFFHTNIDYRFATILLFYKSSESS